MTCFHQLLAFAIVYFEAKLFTESNFIIIECQRYEGTLFLWTKSNYLGAEVIGKFTGCVISLAVFLGNTIGGMKSWQREEK